MEAIWTGPDHEPSLHVTSLPPPTATQKLDEPQDTELSAPPVPLISTALDHDVPIHIIARPLESTATQKLGEVHDTELRLWVPPSTSAADDDHDVPFQVDAPPNAEASTQ